MTAVSPLARVRQVDLIWVDRAVAMLFAAGAVADAASQPRLSLGPLDVVALVVLMGTVAWRRRDPARTTFVAVTALIVFEAASRYDGDGSLLVAAIALNFYTLGGDAARRSSVLPALALLAYWAVGATVIAYVQPGGSPGPAAGVWAFAGVLPFGLGFVLERRRALVRRLGDGAARLRGEQELRARRAAAEERNRVARELHDVVAHCLSVMVVQTAAARRVAAADAATAREALRVVQGAGREALVELRRLVGVLRRDDGGPSEAPGLGAAQMEALAERARSAGLPVDVHVEGRTADLPAGLALTAYRLVQEALTNALKHAGPAHATVNVRVGERALEVEVADSGRGVTPAVGGSGHGLVGMAERVRMYGGELQSGPGPDGGFAVAARIPLDGAAVPPAAEGASPGAAPAPAEDRDGLRWPWLDAALASVLLVALVTAVVTAHHRRGPLALNVVVVAAIALAAVWRRRAPLLFLIVVAVLGSVMNAFLVELKTAPLIGAYFVLVPSFAVGAWAEDREAAFGLLFLLGGAAVSELIVQHGKVGDFTGAALTVGAAWAAGRALRSHRLMSAELRRTSARLVREREDRARLAVAAERSRIARDLHALIADSVEAMVVQAEAATALIASSERERAEEAMSAVEDTGRLALGELRRVLGVLRHPGARGERRPQPGIGEIYALIESARERGQRVGLTVDGDGGSLAPGVELGLYRILESALERAGDGRGHEVQVSLRFGEQELELALTARCDGPNGWPTQAMRERLLLCGGRVDHNGDAGGGWRFNARIPSRAGEAIV